MSQNRDMDRKVVDFSKILKFFYLIRKWKIRKRLVYEHMKKTAPESAKLFAREMNIGRNSRFPTDPFEKFLKEKFKSDHFCENFPKRKLDTKIKLD